jgi:hypothetical protein
MFYKIVLILALFFLISSLQAQIQKVEKRSDNNIVTTEISINGITDRLEQISSPLYSLPDNPASITEGLWEGNHDVRFRVITQTKIDTFSIAFYNVGSCSWVNIKVYPLNFSGNTFNISLDWSGYSAGFVNGTFNSEGDSISGSFSYTNYSCGGSVSGDWYATPSFEQPTWNIVWEEIFDDTSPPPGWIVIDNDGSGSQYLLIQQLHFFLTNEYVYPQAGSSFWWSSFVNANDDGLIDEWLISPMLDMITDESVLIIWAGAVGDYSYADSLRIWISDTDQNLSSFDDMIAYFKVDGPIGNWHEYSFDISDYAGKQIYVAANYYILHGGIGGYDSDNLWVDHFCIAEPVLVSVEEEQIDEIPTEFLLSQNYPNPFNPSTKIKYSVPKSSNVVIKVFDILGNEIETLVSEEKPAGTYEVTWYAEQLPSGVYFYQLKAGGFVQTRKMLLLK